MRLLRFQDGRLTLTEFLGRTIPPYSILSHRWGDEEVTFRDVAEDVPEDLVKNKAGYKKIEFCIDRNGQNGIDYFWLDTCCIDKASSAELQEAINSMFRWYRDAQHCYVYLPDVSVASCNDEWKKAFCGSEWFTRGWTLQELIAPSRVEFYTGEGLLLGEKSSPEMLKLIHDTTGIDVRALEGQPLHIFDERAKLGWARNRETTREEDVAYCLMGVFEVAIPVLYGEGQKRAMKRLKRAIRDAMRESETEDEEPKGPGPLVIPKTKPTRPSLEPPKSLRAAVLWDYDPGEDNEIQLKEGGYISNIEQIDPDWWLGQNLLGERGLFPSNHVRLIEWAPEMLGADADNYPQEQREEQERVERERERDEEIKRIRKQYLEGKSQRRTTPASDIHVSNIGSAGQISPPVLSDPAFQIPAPFTVSEIGEVDIFDVQKNFPALFKTKQIRDKPTINDGKAQRLPLLKDGSPLMSRGGSHIPSKLTGLPATIEHGIQRPPGLQDLLQNAGYSMQDAPSSLQGGSIENHNAKIDETLKQFHEAKANMMPLLSASLTASNPNQQSNQAEINRIVREYNESKAQAGKNTASHARSGSQSNPDPATTAGASPSHESTPLGLRNKTATALFAYEAGEDNEISFPEGAKIMSVGFVAEHWCVGIYNGKEGLFPANYVHIDQ